MIGLIFGETSFPKEILKKVKKKKKKYLIIDLTKNRIFKREKNCFTVSIGQFGKIINILKENNCKKVIFAGSVKKPNFSKLRLDLKGIYYMPRIIKSSKLGDAAILKEFIKRFFEKSPVSYLKTYKENSQLNLFLEECNLKEKNQEIILIRNTILKNEAKQVNIINKSLESIFEKLSPQGNPYPSPFPLKTK